MIWETLEDIKDHFNISESEPREILKILKKQRENLHPDKNGGNFNDQKHRTQYDRVNSAIEFLEGSKNTQLSIKEVQDLVNPITEMMKSNQEIVKAFTDLMKGENKSIKQDPQFIKTSMRDDIKSNYTLPKVGSATFATVFTVILTFSKNISEHPVLGKWFGHYLETTVGFITLLYLLSICIVLFSMAWLDERRLINYAEYLTTEEGISFVIHRMIEEDFIIPGEWGEFTLEELASVLEMRKRKYSFSPFSRDLDLPTRNRIAEYIVRV